MIKIKKLIALLISVIILAVPITVGAATSNNDNEVSFKMLCGKVGYTFTTYQLATVNKSTGEYTFADGVPEKIQSMVTASDSTKDILTELDKITDETELGTAIDTFVSHTSEKEIKAQGGLFYIKATKTPNTVISVQNSLLALPYYVNGEWIDNYPKAIDLATKVANRQIAGSVEITKTDIADGKLLSNAGFEIKDSTGKVVASGYTDSDGVAKFDNLVYGKYTYREFKAPAGYILDKREYPFDIKEDGEVVKCNITNKKEPGEAAAAPKPDNVNAAPLGETIATGDNISVNFILMLISVLLLSSAVILILKKQLRN